MSWSLVFTERYNRRTPLFLRNHPDMREAYHKTLLLFEANPHHPSLCLDALRGRLQGLHSVAINMIDHMTLEALIEGQTLIPIDIGSHNVVYRA